MSSISARSNATKRSDPGWPRWASSIAELSGSLSLRATAMARYPAAASLRTMPRPSPRLPPVTRTLRISAHDLACRSNGQRRNKVDRRRDLVPGKCCATVLKDRVLESLAASVRGAGFSVQNHVSDDERAHDGVLLGPHLRYAHLRVRIDHRFDLLRVHLLAADVDDAVPSADEVIALTAELHDVPRVDEAVGIREGFGAAAQIPGCGSRRANPQRAILDLHLHAGAVAPDQARRKSRQPVAHFKPDAGFRRSERMHDGGRWIESPEMIEDCLVGDFSRQADVLKRKPARRWAHQGVAPMSWRSQ